MRFNSSLPAKGSAQALGEAFFLRLKSIRKLRGRTLNKIDLSWQQRLTKAKPA